LCPETVGVVELRIEDRVGLAIGLCQGAARYGVAHEVRRVPLAIETIFVSFAVLLVEVRPALEPLIVDHTHVSCPGSGPHAVVYLVVLLSQVLSTCRLGSDGPA
jgi:hypothetical protein